MTCKWLKKPWLVLREGSLGEKKHVFFYDSFSPLPPVHLQNKKSGAPITHFFGRKKNRWDPCTVQRHLPTNLP